MLVVRPLSILICTHGSKLNLREKVFLAWIAQRGIVAASGAALFALLLDEQGHAESGKALVALTFSTILFTVLLNGVTANILARLLGIQARESTGILIVGANELAIQVAQISEKDGLSVLMVDTNVDLCQRARKLGLRVYQGNAHDPDRLVEQNLSGIGTLLVLTSSASVNSHSCAQTAPALRLPLRYSVVTATMTEEERLMIAEAGGKTAFARTLDVGSILGLLRDGKAVVHALGGGQAADLKQPFLPLTVKSREGLRLFVYGEHLPNGATVSGLLFQVPIDDAVPFAPALPTWQVKGKNVA